MAKKGGTYDIKFAKLDLTQNDKPEFETWLQKAAPSIEDAYQIACDAGYRCTTKLDERGGGYMCSWTTVSDTHPNSGVVLISRSEDAVEAFWLSFYKTFSLLPDERWPCDDDNLSAWE